MKKVGAKTVFPITQEPIENGVIIIDDLGQIKTIDTLENHDPSSVDFFENGVIIPGLVNTHCHLELSHMKGITETGTGLIPFIQKVVSFRDFPMGEILDAIKQADQEMYEAGIVAVGDISNKLDTAKQKNESALRYYTFVEMFDFLSNENAAHWFGEYKKVFDEQSEAKGNRKSCVPHAPYSVSRQLFHLINQENPKNSTVSIHNQETVHENQFFIDKTGDLIKFYAGFNLPIDEFQPTGQPSIQYAIANMDPSQRTLFVHNTMSTPTDIEAAHQWNDQVYWATCPNANLYIENRLPNYQYFLDSEAKMTIGTDSLTSNWQLSIFEEMKTIQKYQSYVSFEKLLRWATLNGAQALGFDDELGSIAIGKKPGLNLITGLEKDLKLTNKATIKRIA